MGIFIEIITLAAAKMNDAHDVTKKLLLKANKKVANYENSKNKWQSNKTPKYGIATPGSRKDRFLKKWNPIVHAPVIPVSLKNEYGKGPMDYSYDEFVAGFYTKNPNTPVYYNHKTYHWCKNCTKMTYNHVQLLCNINSMIFL